MTEPDNPFQLELFQTCDGSHTLKLIGKDEQYHSLNGAMQESQHVFIQAGLKPLLRENGKLFLLEIGLGTGLNALLTVKDAIDNQCNIYYDAIEAYPLKKKWITKLNHPDMFEEEWIHKAFHLIHSADEKEYVNIENRFFIKCFRQKVQEVILNEQYYHLVYFDAFGPDTQPELWTEEIFTKIANSMRQGAILVTYSAKGAVRRAMKAVGLQVEKIPGPPGKREITRAVKI